MTIGSMVGADALAENPGTRTMIRAKRGICSLILSLIEDSIKPGVIEMSYMLMTELSSEDRNRIVEMAWEDRTPFEAIEMQFGLSEKEVIRIMRREMSEKSFKLWRKRVTNRVTKHLAKRSIKVDRFKCSRQRLISSNKISKR